MVVLTLFIKSMGEGRNPTLHSKLKIGKCYIHSTLYEYKTGKWRLKSKHLSAKNKEAANVYGFWMTSSRVPKLIEITYFKCSTYNSNAVTRVFFTKCQLKE